MSEYIVREIGFPGTLQKEIVQELVRCGECDLRYEMLDGDLECSFHEFCEVPKDGFCHNAKIGEGTKETPPKPMTEEEKAFWAKFGSFASSATILDEDNMRRLEALGLVFGRGKDDGRQSDLH